MIFDKKYLTNFLFLIFFDFVSEKKQTLYLSFASWSKETIKNEYHNLILPDHVQ